MTPNETILITRRIQLHINSREQAYIQQCWQAICQWQAACFRAANYIITHRFIQEQVKDLFYLTEATLVKLADNQKDTNGILTTSKLNTTYQVLANHFKGQVPMHILSSLNMTLSRQFNYEKQAYRQGEKTLRNYKKDIPIPFKGTDIRQLQHTTDGRNFTFNLFGIPLRTYLGHDTTDKKALLDKVLTGATTLATSSLQIKKGKLYLLANIHVPPENHSLDTSIIAEASLSIHYPIIVTIEKKTHIIGNKEEFLYRRLAIQNTRQRLQKAASYNRSGKGRKRKLKALENYADTEKNYINNRLHLYSRQLIDTCIQHRAATILLTNQQAKESIVKEDGFLLRNWGYYALKEKIAYKAAKAGIALIEE